MKTDSLARIICAALALAALLAGPPAVALNIYPQPIYLGGAIPPLVMLTVPKDHQLFKKAYDDYSDLDGSLAGGDTALETTYKHSIDYYGYFDPYKCYDYVNAGTANARFESTTSTSDKKCSAKWSGNFLNWVSMSRIDIMRKLFYGGLRSTDIDGTTVLERAGVPTSAHSWAKYYKGNALASVAEVTPFSTALTTERQYTSTTSNTIAASGTKTFTLTNPNNVVHPMVNGDQVTICDTANPTTRCMYARVTTENFGTNVSITFTVDGSIGSGTIANWTITNLSSVGITICNATFATTGNTQTSTASPLMRVAAGNYAFWASGDSSACRWTDESATDNGNLYFFSEIPSNSKSPLRNTSANPTVHLNVSSVTNGDYVVRVLACPSSPLSLIGTERCTQYPNGNWKPTGLLQDYASGQQKKITFGLMSGSFQKPKSGGVLRKNAGFLDSATTANPSLYDATVDEIDAGTGKFNTTTTVPGIIRTFNSIRLFGWDFSAKNFSASDGCTPATLLNAAEPNCSSFPNPISEIYVETLRYLAGKTADTNFTYTDTGSKDATLGLLQPAWSSTVLSNTNYCTPLNIITLNSSVNSYDHDQYIAGLFTGGDTAQTLTKKVGDYESITGNSYFVGSETNASTNSSRCTAKTVSDLGLAAGLCPEAPGVAGSFRIAGAAHWAKTNRIRSDLTVPTTDTRSLKVTSYGVALASGAPVIRIPVPGSSPTRYVNILPALRVIRATSPPTEMSGGQIVDFKIVRQDLVNGTGKFWVAWDDSETGNDYDLDVSGTISYAFTSSNTQIVVTTKVTTGAAGFSHGFGFVISGTTAVGASDGAAPTISPSDGLHIYSGFKGGGGTPVTYNFPTGLILGATTGGNQCNDCQLSNAAASRTFALSTSTTTSGLLQDPLWYASKYGGFVDQNGNSRPDLTSEWDNKINATSADGSDGNPDTFFAVTNPAGLETALDRAFIAVLQTSSASSVATNSTSLQSGSIVYQARFNSNEWSGQLLAFSISTTGAINPAPLWDAGQLLPSPTARTIITYNRSTTTPGQAGSPKGIPFRWANVSLNSKYATNLNTNGSGVADIGTVLCTGVTATGLTPSGCTLQGSLRLDWLRGDPANEGATATKYRVRPTTKLGDIVNSTPGYVGPPSTLQYGDFSPPAAVYSGDTAYTTFTTTYANRTPMIYAGGNDGMLHGFDASTGATKGIEKLAYVPSMVMSHLTKLTDKTYQHRYFVDGTPTIGDVYINGQWRTILVGGLNGGGQGVYALDITDPSTFSEANANSIVLWEWNDFNDYWLGSTFSQPSIAKMANGKWAVIFGNGYNNTDNTSVFPDSNTTLGSGCGTLYILFIEGGTDGVWTAGTDYRFIDVTNGCSSTVPNGLSTPRVVSNSSGVAQYIYAGDLNGRLWKFDVTSTNSGSWALSNGTTPLFYATDDVTPTSPYVALTAKQPITAAPTSVAHSSGTGTMILFGTGLYLQLADTSSPYTTQSFYGIWDKNDGTTIAGRSKLLRQKILGTSLTNRLGTTVDDLSTSTIDESGFRITTPYTPNYTSGTRGNTFFGETLSNAQDEYATTPAQRGWYLDFPYSGDYGSPTTAGTGERSVFRPIISTGKLVFTTLVPSAASCEAGGTSFIMDLNPETGARLANSPFDINGDLNFSSADYISDPAGNKVAVSGKASTIGLVPTPTVIQMTPAGSGAAGKEVKVLSGSSGQLISVLELGGAATLPGAVGRRVTWRELLND